MYTYYSEDDSMTQSGRRLLERAEQYGSISCCLAPTWAPIIALTHLHNSFSDHPSRQQSGHQPSHPHHAH
jgi:hypothetical protein